MVVRNPLCASTIRTCSLFIYMTTSYKLVIILFVDSTHASAASSFPKTALFTASMAGDDTVAFTVDELRVLKNSEIARAAHSVVSARDASMPQFNADYG
ncbi:hypothetical protein EVAR_901_1 [Eumeta japonica]|uniref:Uncharacterized protein n=1 Tax=Eumeta variegata TaxID=151549 RepID=A0A4C1SGL4_EUMVA|nr:hypothetical protein EVAR_901_1 [Eumeta japonica]